MPSFSDKELARIHADMQFEQSLAEAGRLAAQLPFNQNVEDMFALARHAASGNAHRLPLGPLRRLRISFGRSALEHALQKFGRDFAVQFNQDAIAKRTAREAGHKRAERETIELLFVQYTMDFAETHRMRRPEAREKARKLVAKLADKILGPGNHNWGNIGKDLSAVSANGTDLRL